MAMNRISWLALALVSAGLLVFLYLRLNEFWSINSDQANALYTAMAMAAGNWRLHGWTVPPDSFWGLDIALIALVWAVTGKAILALRLVPALAYLLLGIAAACLCLPGRKSAARLGASMLLAVALLVPLHIRNAETFFSESPMHFLTVACILGVIGLAARSLTAPPARRWIFLLLYSLLSLDAALSDPMFTILGTLPILIALALADFPAGAPRIRLAACGIGVTLLAKTLLAINMATGGFTPSPTQLAFGRLFAMPRSTGIILKGILDVLACDPFGLSLHQAMIQLLRMPLLLLVGLPLYRVGEQILGKWWFKRPGSRAPAFIETGLFLIIALNLAAMQFTAQVIDIGGIRYLLPAWACAVVLAARTSKPGLGINSYYALLLVVGLGADAQAMMHRAPPAFTPVTQRLATCLESVGLDNGYGVYWRASAVTLASDGRVTVRAVHTNITTHAVTPMMWMSTTRWYPTWPPARPFFVITDPKYAGLSNSAVLASFGTPDSVLKVGSAVVNIYGRHIAPGACSGADQS